MKKLITMLLLLTAGISLFAGDELTAQEKAMFTKNVVIPTPSEIIVALNKLTEVNWKTVVGYNTGAAYTENYKLALNLGVRVADGFVAIQAKDKKNVGEMFAVSKTIAENFGGNSKIFSSKDEVVKMIDKNDWKALRSKLDDMHLKVQAEMKKYHPDFVVLASIGGWLEGLNAVSTTLAAKYDQNASNLLYQPKLVEHFMKEMDKLQDTNKNYPLVKKIREALPEIAKLCEAENSKSVIKPVSKQNVEQLAKISSELVKSIVKGE